MARCRVNGRVHATDLSMSPGKRDSIFRDSQYDRFAGYLRVLAKRSPRSLQRQSEGLPGVLPGVLPGAGDIVSYPAVSIHGETTFGFSAISVWRRRNFHRRIRISYNLLPWFVPNPSNGA